VDLESLADLSARLKCHVLDDSSELKANAHRHLCGLQRRSVLVARAFYCLILSGFFPSSDARKISSSELFTHIFINESDYLDVPGCKCAQILQRAIRLMRGGPTPFARALLHSHTSIPLRFFAFSTFPAIFGYFTTSENVNFASQFMIALMSLDPPECLVGPLFQSFLLANYPFADALWTNLHGRVCARQRINEQTAIESLCGSIEACGPLMSFAAYRVIQEVMGRLPTLCCNEVLRFLRISFQLWHDHSPEGLSFGCGDSFLEYLALSEDFLVGNSMMIVASILKTRRRVPSYPGFGNLADRPSESIVFSCRDFSVFRKAFEDAEPKIALFHTIEVDGAMDDLAPFLLETFPIPGTQAVRQPLISIGDIPEIALTVDGVYELAISQGVRIQNSAFEEYALKKSIIDAKLKMNDFEDFLSLRLAARSVTHFLKSVRRFRDFCFARYCRKLFEAMEIRSSATIKQMADRMLAPCSELPSIFKVFLVEWLNVAALGKPPPTAVPLFEALTNRHAHTTWYELRAFSGMKRMIELVPAATRRPLERYGDVFLLFSYIFWANRKIRRHFSALEDSEKHFKFLALNSHFRRLLHIFIYFDALFRQKFLRERLDSRLLADWDCFLKMMRNTVKSDEVLYNTIAPSSASRRK
jgi:hypothetical protein